MLARVHDGPGAPIVRLRWVYTDAPFLPVGTGCVINNRVWNEDSYSDLPVGQLQPVVADFTQDARWKLPPGLPNEHICHAEWLPTGEPWPNDLPPQEYTCSDWPICCGVIDDCPRGGVEIGGSAGDVYYPSDPTSGGVVIGGSAGDRYYPSDPTSGGVVIGGSAGDVYSAPDPAEGGVEIGGEAGDVYSAPDPAEGGVEIGGSAGDYYPNGMWERDIPGHYTFVPEATMLHRIIVYAGGGAGGNNSGGGGMNLGGGGGGGGAESNIDIVLTGGASYDVDVGHGGVIGIHDGEDTVIQILGTVVALAKGGFNAVDNSGGVGGDATSGVGDQRWSGGHGADSGPDLPGGGGGSSACYSPTSTPAGTGNDATDHTGAAPPLPDGGTGGDGGTTFVNGQPGTDPGGGGGGADNAGGTPGQGGAGRIIIFWPPSV